MVSGWLNYQSSIPPHTTLQLISVQLLPQPTCHHCSIQTPTRSLEYSPKVDETITTGTLHPSPRHTHDQPSMVDGTMLLPHIPCDMLVAHPVISLHL